METMYIATQNKDKVADFKLIFEPLGIHLELLTPLVNVPETAPTLLENAEQKALANAAMHPDKRVFATDGGLIIPFLGEEWNTVMTRRLSGRDPDGATSDRQRAETLLLLMESAASDTERSVFWEEAFAIAQQDTVLFRHTSKGAAGVLLKEIPEHFSESGYWAAYLMYEPRFRKTYMELSPEEKMAVSTVKQELSAALRSFFAKRKR